MCMRMIKQITAFDWLIGVLTSLHVESKNLSYKITLLLFFKIILFIYLFIYLFV